MKMPQLIDDLFWLVLPFAILGVVINYRSKIKSTEPLPIQTKLAIALWIGAIWISCIVFDGVLVLNPYGTNNPYEFIIQPVVLWTLSFWAAYILFLGATFLIFKFLKPGQPFSALALLSLQPTSVLMAMMLYGHWRDYM